MTRTDIQALFNENGIHMRITLCDVYLKAYQKIAEISGVEKAKKILEWKVENHCDIQKFIGNVETSTSKSDKAVCLSQHSESTSIAHYSLS